jgi:hypothetical protein
MPVPSLMGRVQMQTSFPCRGGWRQRPHTGQPRCYPCQTDPRPLQTGTLTFPQTPFWETCPSGRPGCRPRVPTPALLWWGWAWSLDCVRAPAATVTPWALPASFSDWCLWVMTRKTNHNWQSLRPVQFFPGSFSSAATPPDADRYRVCSVAAPLTPWALLVSFCTGSFLFFLCPHHRRLTGTLLREQHHPPLRRALGLLP